VAFKAFTIVLSNVSYLIVNFGLLQMKTGFLSKKDAQESRKWVIVDVANKPVGRVASGIAALLRGKNSPMFTKHQNAGDYVVVINASKVKFTGKKSEQKKYYDYSGYIGGLREQTAAEVLERKPERVILSAVKGMLPRGALGHKVIKKLKIYAGAEHPHTSQNPQLVEVPL
jgi:large subunit ribosomal protein L13